MGWGKPTRVFGDIFLAPESTKHLLKKRDVIRKMARDGGMIPWWDLGRKRLRESSRFFWSSKIL